MPPATRSVSPVIHAESDEARNTAAGATSSTSPMRRRGACVSSWVRSSLLSKPPARTPSVSTMPGLIAFTRMLRGPSSLASVRVIASTAPFVAVYTAEAGGVMLVAVELTMKMLPPSSMRPLAGRRGRVFLARWSRAQERAQRLVAQGLVPDREPADLAGEAALPVPGIQGSEVHGVPVVDELELALGELLPVVVEAQHAPVVGRGQHLPAPDVVGPAPPDVAVVAPEVDPARELGQEAARADGGLLAAPEARDQGPVLGLRVQAHEQVQRPGIARVDRQVGHVPDLGAHLRRSDLGQGEHRTADPELDRDRARRVARRRGVRHARDAQAIGALHLRRGGELQDHLARVLAPARLAHLQRRLERVVLWAQE